MIGSPVYTSSFFILYSTDKRHDTYVVTYVHGGSAYKLEALEVSSVGLTPITSINIKQYLIKYKNKKKNIKN